MLRRAFTRAAATVRSNAPARAARTTRGAPTEGATRQATFRPGLAMRRTATRSHCGAAVVLATHAHQAFACRGALDLAIGLKDDDDGT
ncbi:unnamed protein product [Phaeothamnion confervicola]